MKRMKAWEILDDLRGTFSMSDDEHEALTVAMDLLSRVGDDAEIVTCVSREDIAGLLDPDDRPRYTPESVAEIDLVRVADKMADAYCDNCFWIDLEIIAEANGAKLATYDDTRN